MGTRVWLVAAAALTTVTWSANDAEAFSGRIAQFPNGNCDYCHIFPGGPRTPFGLDVDRTYNGSVNWPALFDLDSDGDGYTNGEELGDPYGLWTRGDANPTLLSDPGKDYEFPAVQGNPPELVTEAVATLEDESYSGAVEANDADGDTLRYRIVEAPAQGTLSFNNETGEFTYTPNDNYFGEDTFSFQAFDGRNVGGVFEGETFVPTPGVVTIFVEPVNDEPTIATEGDQAVNENQLLLFEVSAQDLEDGVPNIEVDGLPEGATFTNGDFQWRPNYNQAGEYSLVFRAVDNDGGEAAEAVTITVNNVNRPPVIEALEAPVDQGQEGVTLSLSSRAVDPDEEPLTFTWNFGDNTDEVSGVGLSEVNHAFGQDGTFTVRLTVTDGTDVTANTVQVVIENVLPSVFAGDDVTVDEGDVVPLIGQFEDPGFLDNHTYDWDYGDGGDSNALEAEHAYGDDGTYTATLTVSDDDGAGSDSRVITVNNVAPVADLGDDRTVDEGEAFTLQGTFEDPGFLDEHTYTWDLGNGVIADDRDAAITYDDQGSFTVTFTVSDDDGGTGSDSVLVTVNNVAPEVVSEAPLYAILEQEYRYQIEAQDPGDDTISYVLAAGPEGMTVSPAGLVTYTPPVEEENNTYTVTVTVSDEDGGETPHTWELLVGLPDRDGDGAPDDCEEEYVRLDPDDPTDGPLDFDNDGYTNAEECQNGTNPIVSNAPNAPSINAPFSGQLINQTPVTLTINNSEDPDGDPIFYTFSVYNDEALTQLHERFEDVPEGQNRTSVTLTAPLTEDGTYHWRVQATDGRGLSPYSNVARFTFSQVNDPPSTPVPQSPQGTVQINPVIFDVSPAIDPENEIPVSYDFQVFDDSTPPQLVDSALGIPGRGVRVQWISTYTFEENGRYSWRTRATDVRGLSSEWSPQVEIVINQINAAPATPTLVSPEDGLTVNRVEGLRFVAGGVEDEDGDEVTYVVRVARDQSFGPGALVVESGPLTANPNDQVVYELPQNTVLTENFTYYWDVRAYDGELYSPAAVRSFLFSAENEAPGAVTIQAPADGTNTMNPSPTFTWLNVTDPEGTPVTYTMEVFSDPQEANRVRRVEGVEGGPDGMTSVEVEALEDGAYHWKVRGIDSDGVRGDWSPLAGFTISTIGEPPTTPVIVEPKDGEVLPFGEALTLVWENATDPEGGAIEYAVEVLKGDQVFTSATVSESADGSGVTTVEVDLALAAGDYTWRVKAQDEELLESGWSDAGAFTIDEPVADPGPALPKEGCGAAPGSPSQGTTPMLLLWLAGMLIVIRRKA